MMKKEVLVTIGLIAVIISACAVPNPGDDGTLSSLIDTRAGKLALSYAEGTAILSGTLSRGTPCVNWAVQAASTKDLPISSVNIKIFDSNKEAICVQMLGDPQEINKTINQVSDNTKYTVTFENEIVFSGTLKGDSK